MNNISIINIILFAVTLFQHSPLTRRVFYNNIRRERGQHHQQHQVSERTTLSTTSWNTDWHIYKSSKAFLINSIVIHNGMKSSSASIWISIKLIHHHHHSTRLTHHHSMRMVHHHNTRLAHYTTIMLESQHNN